MQACERTSGRGCELQSERVGFLSKWRDLDFLHCGILVYLEKSVIICDLLGFGFPCSHGGRMSMNSPRPIDAQSSSVTTNGMADFLKLGSSTSPTGLYTLLFIDASLHVT